MRHAVAFCFLLVSPAVALGGGHPDCAGVERWATKMAFVHLKNAGLTDSHSVIWEKTETRRLASEQIGTDLYRQVHRVTFTDSSGAKIEVITVNDASNAECSMTGVDVYVVSRHLGGR